MLKKVKCCANILNRDNVSKNWEANLIEITYSYGGT